MIIPIASNQSCRCHVFTYTVSFCSSKSATSFCYDEIVLKPILRRILAYKIHVESETHCNLSNISDAMISKMKATKSISESEINSDWSTTIHLSSPLRYPNEYLFLEASVKSASKLNHFGQNSELTDRSVLEDNGKLLTEEYVKLFNRSLPNNDTATTKSFGGNSTKKQKLYSCAFCDFYCAWQYDLKVHLKHKHNFSK